MPPRLPAKSNAKPSQRPTCETELVYRQWKESAAVRMVAVRCDRLFEFPGGADVKAKISIKTAVHNQHAPNNKHAPADSDEEDDVVFDDDLNDDMIFDPSDMEVESEDDSWFDQFVARELSANNVEGEAQPAVADSQRDNSCAIVEDEDAIVIDTQLMEVEGESLAPTELDPPTPAAISCKEPSSPGRMVARPLAGEFKDVVQIVESPNVKKELVSVASDPSRSLREKEAHKRWLMGRLAELNRAIEFEAYLFANAISFFQKDPSSMSSTDQELHGKSVVIDESLPFGMDNGSTLAMDLDVDEVTASVAHMINKEESLKAELKTSALPESCGSSASDPSKAVADVPKVLTRRDQLGLAQEAKDDSKAGKGRGRGRGRGRGKIAERVEEKVLGPSSHKDDVPEKPVERKLKFGSDDENGEEPKQDVAPPEKTEIDPAPKNKSRKRTAAAKPKAKAKAKPSKDADAGGSAECPMAASPPIKQKEKRRKNGKDSKQEAVAPSSADIPAEGQLEANAEKKKGPGRALVTFADKHMKDASNDPATWFHVAQLWPALADKSITQDKWQTVAKPHYWSYSMYWKTKRCGLLTKNANGGVHVTSFGGVWTRNIALSLQAAQMFVAASVEFVGGDKPVDELKMALDSDQATAYIQALQDLVKAISIADSMGKSMKDFEPE
eukprot:Skav214218  [mRNA]  locus=scaffold489:544926:549630:+ [translate_table: standard]